MEPQVLNRGAILLLYVKLRRNGSSRAEAQEKVKTPALILAIDERHLLGNEINQWEQEYTAKQGAQQAQQPATQTGPHPALSDNPPPANGGVTSDSPFSVQPLDPANVPLDQANVPLVLYKTGLPQLCPKCKQKNKTNAQRCTTCGALLKSSGAPTIRFVMPDSDRKSRPGKPGHVFLGIKGCKEPLEVFVRTEMIVGRSSIGSSIRPDIDLGPYDGQKLGVSRSHAALKMQGETIVITDLESSNFTYINGERLYPHETRVLRHGDEIQLGKLTVKVTFKL